MMKLTCNMKTTQGPHTNVPHTQTNRDSETMGHRSRRTTNHSAQAHRHGVRSIARQAALYSLPLFVCGRSQNAAKCRCSRAQRRARARARLERSHAGIRLGARETGPHTDRRTSSDAETRRQQLTIAIRHIVQRKAQEGRDSWCSVCDVKCIVGAPAAVCLLLTARVHGALHAPT
jgi:hypothetical protein